MERDQALSLLRAQHTIPGPFEFRAFIRPEGRVTVVTAVRAACAAEGELLGVDERASRQGRWISLRLKVHVQSAEQVLSIYDLLKTMEEVVLTL